MEIEHNPVFPNPDQVQKSNVESFNDQLKEIDQAINYMPYGENTPEQNSGQYCNDNFLIHHGSKSVGPKSHAVSPFASPTRRPLKDISNGPCNNLNQSPALQNGRSLRVLTNPPVAPQL